MFTISATTTDKVFTKTPVVTTTIRIGQILIKIVKHKRKRKQ